jgi:solute carrier family 25 aspartate/glutamate transporter 12/13
MADLSKAKEVVKETLLGSEQVAEVQLSAQSKAAFDKNARKDAETGELFMGEEEFINAVAPESEDYVSQPRSDCCAAIIPTTQSHWLMRNAPI